MSVGYNNAAHGITMTVYVYPIAQRGSNSTLSGHFSSCKAEIFMKHSGAKLVSEKALQISVGGAARNGQHAMCNYSELFARQHQDVGSELYVFKQDKRFIKYRSTYPIGQKTVAEPAIHAFLEDLAWPPGGSGQ
jgi:hypothetical protein